MPRALLSREQWGHVHATAVALQSIQEAARAHGVSAQAAYKRAQREGWLVGKPATVVANRAERVERAKAAGAVIVSTPAQDAHRPAADVIDGEIIQNGKKTRAMLSQALRHAAGQARRTKHPLRHSRHIRDVVSAAAIVHPGEFGTGAAVNAGGQDHSTRIHAAVVNVFGRLAGEMLLERDVTPVLPVPQEEPPEPAQPEDTGGQS